MRCPKCGKDVRDGLTFCPFCGAEFIDSKQKKQKKTEYDEQKKQRLEEAQQQNNWDEAPKKKFYQKTWFIILLLILFWPVGMFLMWRYARWNKIAKVIVTILIAIIFIFGIIPDNDNNSEPEKPDKAVMEQEETKTTSDDSKTANSENVKEKQKFEFGFKNNTMKDSNCKFTITDSKIVSEGEDNTIIIYFDYSYEGSPEAHNATSDFSTCAVMSQGTYKSDGKTLDNELGLGRNDEYIEWDYNYTDPDEGEIGHAEYCWTLSDTTTPIKLAYDEQMTGKSEYHIFNIIDNKLVLKK